MRFEIWFDYVSWKNRKNIGYRYSRHNWFFRTFKWGLTILGLNIGFYLERYPNL